MSQEQEKQKSQSQGLLEIIGRLSSRESRDINTALARELNNHIWCRAKFGKTGDLTAEDTVHIFKRWILALQTIGESETIVQLPSGPDVYGKRNGGATELHKIQEAMVAREVIAEVMSLKGSAPPPTEPGTQGRRV